MSGAADHGPLGVGAAGGERPWAVDGPPPGTGFRDIVAWDGVLPWVVSAAPLYLPVCLPNLSPVTIGFLTVGIIPITAALVRAHLGGLQLARLHDGDPPLDSQILFALAIIAVFLFEMASCVLHNVQGEPLRAWLVPLAFYATYLLLAYAALRPPARPPADPAD